MSDRPRLAPPIPAWATWLMAIAPLGDRRADVETDFAELFADRLARYGRVYAHRRLCSDIVSLGRGRLRGGSMLQDLRFVLRLFRKHPAPVGIAIGGLALAIGVVTSVFTIVDASMLRHFEMDEPASVMNLGSKGERHWSYTWFLKLQNEATLTRVEASNLETVRVGTQPGADGDSSRPLMFVSGRYLQTLGGRPSLGRALEPSDDNVSAPPVVVVSHYFWSTQLNADPSVVGTTLWLNGAAVTLVGVLRPGFTGPTKVRPAAWAPFAAYDEVRGGPPFDAGNRTSVDVVVRRAPGVATQAAQAELDAIITRSSPPASTAAEAEAQAIRLSSLASPIDQENPAEAYTATACLVAILGLVIAVACANTANLLLAAATTRMPEMGLRLALGASTRRLVRQMVSESLLLGLVAGGLGFLFAVWFVPILGVMLEMSPEFKAVPDGRVLLFTVAVALACGLGAGLSPARYGARGNVLGALKSQNGSEGGGAGAPTRLRTSFVGFQAAVSMLMLVSAALLGRTAMLMARTDIGFDVDRLIVVSLEPPRSGFDEAAYIRTALSAVRDLPSVERASATQSPPFGFSWNRDDLTHDGKSYELNLNRTDADFFATAGLRMLRGRGFGADEVSREAPVAVISDSVARAFFPGSDPVGGSVTNIPSEKGRQEHATIVGVVSDALMTPVRSQGYGAIYRPISLVPLGLPGSHSRTHLVIRTANAGLTARAVEDALERIDPRVRPRTSFVREGLDMFLGSKRTLALLSAPTAILAVLLAALGVFGVTAFVVSQRTHEVSLRMAIGASSADVLRLLVKDSLRPVIIGLAAGLGLALVVSRLSAGMLAGISPHDPLAIGVATATLVAGAIVAVIIPARRAAKADPASLLRHV